MHPALRLKRLPAADIPEQVARCFEPNWMYTPIVQMMSEGDSFLFQIGARIITINCRKPYSGWDAFKAQIEQMINIIDESKTIKELVGQPKSHSLRYLDFLTLGDPPDLSVLKFSFKICDKDIQKCPIQMKVELAEDGFKHIVQVIAPAELMSQPGSNTRRKGVAIDLETFNDVNQPMSWNDVRSQIDSLHDKSKSLFFEKLLTKEAIDRLGPEF
jgi:uncharacterized protein (TIGR04255 family)